jgi:hypothetical protein
MLVNMDGDLLVLCARLATLVNHAKSTRNPALFHHQNPSENLRTFRQGKEHINAEPLGQALHSDRNRIAAVGPDDVGSVLAEEDVAGR